MIDKWKAKDDNRPYETPKCPLSLSALQPYEVKVPLEISDSNIRICKHSIECIVIPAHQYQYNLIVMYLCGNIKVSLSSSFHIFKPHLEGFNKIPINVSQKEYHKTNY